MELLVLHKRVAGLDEHQAQITAGAILEEADGTTRIEHRQFSAFKRDRRALADCVSSLAPDGITVQEQRVGSEMT